MTEVLKILVVDDDQGFRRALVRVIKLVLPDAYIVSTSDPRDALPELLGTDLLITDFDMGYMSGRDLAEAARRILPHIKIIMVSGMTRSKEDVRMADVFLEKPFDLEIFKGAIREALDV